MASATLGCKDWCSFQYIRQTANRQNNLLKKTDTAIRVQIRVRPMERLRFVVINTPSHYKAGR